MRAALPAFDARLQAELLNGWDTEVLSRSGLSAVVFEQKLRAAGNASAPSLRVLPSDFLVLSVLDQPKKQLRVFVNRVGTGMTLGSPKIFPVRNPGDIANGLPGKVARHVASVAGLAARVPAIPHKNQKEQPLVCSLLEPVSAGGAQADLSKISPLIRAVLEDVVASDDAGATLVERSEMAKLLDEKALNATNGLNANGSTDLGRMAKADLILIPFIHFQNSQKIGTDLFAVDVATGRMLACRSWSGALLDAPPSGIVKELLQEGLHAAGESIARPVADDPALRHAEAAFIISLKEGWDGLRQLAATEAELSIRLGDASLALASDDPAVMRKAAATFYRAATPGALYPLQMKYNPTDEWLRQISELEKSGQLDLIYQQARRIFDLPMTELAKDNADKDLQLLGELWIRLGDAEKGWSILNRGGRSIEELAGIHPFYQSLVVALMNLGRYQECVDLLERRGKWSSMCTPIILDAYRALNNTKREFQLMRGNSASTCKTEPMTARFLDLSRDQGEAGPTIGNVVRNANAWVINSPLVRMAMIRARISAGQKDLAIADAQCALIAATKAKDPVAREELTGILNELGAKPLASLPAARDFLTLPADCRIDLIHDQTVDPKYVAEVSAHVARFWGCAVHVRSIQLDAPKFSSYRKLSQALDGNVFADTLARIDLPAGPALATVVLTQTKLISVLKNYTGDIYSVNRGALTILSDHYFRKFKSEDPRPLSQITAIAAAALASVSKKIFDNSKVQGSWENVFCPPHPDLFSNNGTLHLAAVDFGISPGTGAFLQKISAPDLLNFTSKIRESARTKAPQPDPADDPLILGLSNQISQARPIIITPSSP
jgi:tetratricopeptide (TPR) repeat protein